MKNLLSIIRSVASHRHHPSAPSFQVHGTKRESKTQIRGLEIRHRQTGHVLFFTQAASLGGLNLRQRNLIGADLEGRWMLGVLLGGAELRHACLRKSTLFQADLEGADLTCADLREADLSRASLKAVNLCGADLRGADLTDATLADARYDDLTLWPFGADPQRHGAIRVACEGTSGQQMCPPEPAMTQRAQQNPAAPRRLRRAFPG